MAGYNSITDAEVTADKPAKASTWAKFRDNLIACFGADDSAETALRLEPGAIRNPVNSDSVNVAVISSTIADLSVDVVIVVPGVYRFIGDYVAANNGEMEIYLNNVSQYFSDTTGSFDEAITCVNGDHVQFQVRYNAGKFNTSTVSNFKIKADVAVPVNLLIY